MFNIVSPQVGKSPELPGTVNKIDGEIVILTGRDYLTLESVQLEGGRTIPVKEFVNGHRDFVGSKLI